MKNSVFKSFCNGFRPVQCVKRFIGSLGLTFCIVMPAMATGAVNIYVGYSPGGLADRLARFTAEALAAELHRTVTVKNLTGVNGVRAALETANGGANSADLLFADTSLLIANQVSSVPSFDLMRFLPVGSFGVTPFALVVPTNSGIKNLDDLIRSMQVDQARINYGSPGIYSVHHLGVESLLKKTKTSAQHIPYQGGAQIVTDLLAGRLTFALLSIHLASQYAQTDQLRVIAVTGPKRTAGMAATPTISELLPGIQTISTAYLLAAPQMNASLHQEIVRAWSKIIQRREVIDQFEMLGLQGPALTAKDVPNLMKVDLNAVKNGLGHAN